MKQSFSRFFIMGVDLQDYTQDSLGLGFMTEKSGSGFPGRPALLPIRQMDSFFQRKKKSMCKPGPHGSYRQARLLAGYPSSSSFS